MKEIIKNNESVFYIVANKNATEAERFACAELQKYLYLSTNCCLPIFSDKCSKKSSEILIGNARNNDIRKRIENMSSEAFIITEINNDVCITGNSGRAILYGVYRFLEDKIGFRCFTSTVEKYDICNDVIYDKELIFDFDFEYREVYFTDAFKSNFASKNMLNSNLADLSSRVGGKTKWFNFHHSFSDIINPNDYFDTHPEYFSMIDGERRKEHTELCLSNPDVFNLTVKKVKEWIKDNPDCKIFSVSQDEWMGHFIRMACECDECKKIDEHEMSQSGSIINFVNKVVREVNKEYPDVLIHTFAYQFSRKPPKYLIPDKNVIVRLCNIECSWSKSIKDEYLIDENSKGGLFYKDLCNWGKITSRLYIWDYCVNFRNYLLPFPNFRSMIKNISLYRESNVKGVLMQGNFSHGGKGYMSELKAYVISRFLRYKDLKLEDEVKEFCDYYYGKSGKYIYDYIFLFEDHISKYDLWLYDDSDHPIFDEMIDGKNIVEVAKDLINKALEVATDDVKERVKEVKLTYDYMYLTRLPLNFPKRNQLIDDFYHNVKEAKITELFERTELKYSINIMKTSLYAKKRDEWSSLYYIMK